MSRWYCDREECDGLPHDGWGKHARTKQRPPAGGWLVWLVLAGRGFGKTRTGAEWITDRVQHGGHYPALVGRTASDVRDVMVEGPDGIMAVSSPSFRPTYHPSKRQVVWPNGVVAHTYSAEEADKLRGPQHDTVWAEELSSWKDARRGDVLDTAWNNLLLGLRVGPDPRAIVTTTPKPNRLTREVRSRAYTVTVAGTTYENIDNLSPHYRETVVAPYEGTRTGRQELLAEILDDLEGALWSLSAIDAGRVDQREMPELRRLVVGVDPTGSDSADADECGIVAVGKGVDGQGYVLRDRTITAAPATWAHRAVALYHELEADEIVAEGNYGGLMVKETIKAVDKTVPVRIVNASRGKKQRAEPVSALYEHNPDSVPPREPRIHHVRLASDPNHLAKLEDELVTWTPESGWSPGRMDALVWACTALKFAAGAAMDAWNAATDRRLAMSDEERAAELQRYAEEIHGVPQRPERCAGSPDGSHRDRGGACLVCGQEKPKEAA